MGIIAIAVFGLMVFIVSTLGTVTALYLEWDEAKKAEEADERQDTPLATVTDIQRRSS